ncbi:MAG: hypothetical protein WBK55_00805 [Alphaproteobacteria bacterium]
MVEGPKGIGSVQNLISGTRVTDAANSVRRSDEVKTSGPKDEIKISGEAISLSQAQEAASSVRESLSQDTELTLGSGRNFDESL